MIGAYSWILTLQEQPDENGEGAVFIKAYIEVDDGQLMLEAITDGIGRLDDVNAVVVRPPVEFTIVGGTRQFADATGEARLILAGADAVFVVDVSCS